MRLFLALKDIPLKIKLFCVHSTNQNNTIYGKFIWKYFSHFLLGESHGGGIGVVIDGCPPQLPLSEDDIQPYLNRRRPRQSKITTPRDEEDKVEILSGVFEGKTTGTPIAMLVRNRDARPQAYDEMKEKFRPSHADFTYQSKFGIRNHEGGGRSSARETIARVAAGAVAQKILNSEGTYISTYVEEFTTFNALLSLKPQALGISNRPRPDAASRNRKVDGRPGSRSQKTR